MRLPGRTTVYDVLKVIHDFYTTAVVRYGETHDEDDYDLEADEDYETYGWDMGSGL